MKILLFSISLSFASCTSAEREKIVANMPPINAEVCYLTEHGKVCVGTDGKVINVGANFSGK